MRWLRNTIAAFFFAFARSTKLATETTVVRPPLEPITTPIRKRYQAEVTIAGGPGSQRIGDTFDALPENIKQQIIAARGHGGYNRSTLTKLGFTDLHKDVPRISLDEVLAGNYAPTQGQRERNATDKIARGLARARGQHYALNERGQTVRTTAPDKNPRPRTETETEV